MHTQSEYCILKLERGYSTMLQTDTGKRDKRVQCLLTAKERNRLKQAALDDGRSVSDFTRRIILKGIETVENRFKPEPLNPEFKG